MTRPVSGPMLDYFRMLAAVASPRATIECVRSFGYTEFYQDMRAVNVPTLIIHGDADKTVPIEPTGNHSAKLIPDSQYIIYEGAPHGLFYTDRERLNKDLIQFIRESVSEGVH